MIDISFFVYATDANTVMIRDVTWPVVPHMGDFLFLQGIGNLPVKEVSWGIVGYALVTLGSVAEKKILNHAREDPEWSVKEG